ncbi:MAG: hypothetical protein ACLR5G_17105 [Eubacteriales bacterium]
MTENKTILSVKDLRFTYSGQEKPALDGVTLEVRRAISSPSSGGREAESRRFCAA